MKFSNFQIQEQIRGASSARDAFNLARQYSNQARADWHQISLETMLQAVRAKFTQHQALKNMLLNTGDKTLVENAGQNDAFFGAGADYNGKNYLGRILMHVRAELSGLIASGTSWAQSPWR